MTTSPGTKTTKPRTRRTRAGSTNAESAPPVLSNVISGQRLSDEQRAKLVNAPWTLDQAREQVRQGYDPHVVARRSGFAVEKIAKATWS